MRGSLSCLLHLTRSNQIRLESTSSYSPSPPPHTSPQVSSIVDDISDLTLIELADLTETLKTRFCIDQIPFVSVMTPGMSVGRNTPSSIATESSADQKVEKTAFDLKLESFDSASKIKIIKEVRTFTDLGLKEAKELVEKAPALIKKCVMKEEAEKIVEKMKLAGAKVVLE